MIGVDDGALLDVDKINVVSKGNIDRVKMPMSILCSPSTASIMGDDGVVANGEQLVEFNHLRPRASFIIEAPGYRSQELHLDWQRSYFENHVVLEKELDQRLVLGDRIVDAANGKGGSVYLCGNGVVYFLRDSALRPLRMAPKSFRTPTSKVFVHGKMVAFGTFDGHILVYNLESHKLVRSEQVSNSAVTQLLSRGGDLLIAIDDGRPRLERRRLATLKLVNELPLPSAPREIRFGADDLVCTIIDNGDMIFCNADTKAVTKQLTGKFRDAVLLAPDRAYGVDEAGRLLLVDLKTWQSKSLGDKDLIVAGALRVLQDGVSFVTAKGQLAFLKNEDVVVSDRVPRRLLKTATGKTFGCNGNEFIIELADARLLRVDAAAGRVLWAYRSQSKIPAVPLFRDGRLYLGCADKKGGLEIYQD